MLTAGNCRETVSILEAIAFGTGGACIDLGMASLLTAIAVFVLAVVILSRFGKLALVLLFGTLFRRRAAPGTFNESEQGPATRGRIGKTAHDRGPIRSHRPRK